MKMLNSRPSQQSQRGRGSKKNSVAASEPIENPNIAEAFSDAYGASSDSPSEVPERSDSRPLHSKASQDEKSSQATKTTEMYKLNWTTNQHKRLHADLLALVEVIYMAETKFRLSERLARRLESIEARLKKKSGSSTADRAELSLTIKDFDPVFRRQDFHKVRQGVLKALHVQPAQEKHTLRSQSLTGKHKLKARFASKFKEQSKKQVHDAVEAEYARAAQKEARKQKAALRRRLDAERLEQELQEKKKNQDYSSDSSSANEQKNEAALLKEMHDAKIKNYIGQFEKKNAFRREKTELYKNKHAVQQV